MSNPSFLQVPAEIWLSIFFWCQHAHLNVDGQLNPVVSTATIQALHISHVCATWREICLGSGKLWSHIDLTSSSTRHGELEVIDELIARSGTATLHLKTLWSQGSLNAGFNVERLRKCLSRAEVLYLQLPTTRRWGGGQVEIPPLFSDDCSWLKRLIVSPEGDGALERERISVGSLPLTGSWSGLRALELHRVAVDLRTLRQSLKSTFDTLEHLELDRCSYPRDSGVIDVRNLLLDVHALRSFAVRRTFHLGENWPFNKALDVPIALPLLRQMSVTSIDPWTIEWFLASFNTPAALTIRWILDPDDDGQISPHEPRYYLPKSISTLTAFSRIRAVSMSADAEGRTMIRGMETSTVPATFVPEREDRTLLISLEPFLPFARFGNVFPNVVHICFSEAPLFYLFGYLLALSFPALSDEEDRHGATCPALSSMAVSAKTGGLEWERSVEAVAKCCEARAEMQSALHMVALECPADGILIAPDLRERLERVVETLIVTPMQPS